MKMILYLKGIAIITLILFACASGKEASVGVAADDGGRNDMAEGTKDQPAGEVAGTNDHKEDSLFASISRGACYGTCPIYKMFIYEDGTVILEGIRFMEPRGKHRGHITEAQMQAFSDMAKEISFFEMEDSYDSPVTDIPAVTTYINVDGKEKSVMRRVGYPQRILKLEQLFDELLKSVDWEMLEAPKD